MNLKRIIIPVLALVALAGCTRVSTEPDQVAIHYEDGPFSAKKYASIVDASTRKTFGPSDKVYYYPTGQRSYDATGGGQSERGPITSTSKDSVDLSTALSVTFELKTDEASLKAFHELIGIKYGASYEKDTKDPSGVSPGWHHMLDFYIGQSLDATTDRILATYPWRTAYGDASVRSTIETAIKNELPTLVQSKMQGNYFQSWAVQVQRPVPTNPDLLKSIADNQNQVAQAEANKAKADADLATAKAQIAVQQAEASKKKADISAYGSVDQYNKAQAIDKGINPYQPTYVVSGTAPENK